MLQGASAVKRDTDRVRSEITRLAPLVDQLQTAKTIEDKESVLDAREDVISFFESHPQIASFVADTEPLHRYIAKEIVAIGEGPIVFRGLERKEQLEDFLAKMKPVERFYDTLGGIAGYHLTVLRLLNGEELGPFGETETVDYSPPGMIDIRESTPKINHSIVDALGKLDSVANLWAVGGAGDRLSLIDRKSSQALPAARLQFCGRSLLAGLVRDVVAREYLAYKVLGKQITTPVMMMTSEEKGNHEHIIAICQKADWFGRGRENFFFFSQPMVPVVTVTGHWSMKKPLKATLKPGGHGVIWKLAQDSGAFDWLAERGKADHLLVRQINNPIAGTDYGLLAFLGVGLSQDKTFGFASCDRRINSAEGMNVVIQTQAEGKYGYRISNVEYMELDKHGIDDVPLEPGSEYSTFPANTNILFAHIPTVQEALKQTPVPGLVINLKKTAPLIDADGTRTERKAGRLESTMQNIADYIVDTSDRAIDYTNPTLLQTYCTYNERSKTLSVAKNGFVPGKTILGTPESAFHTLLSNQRDLLVNSCGWQLPPLAALKDTLDTAPSFVVLTHPALGPLYSVIASKLRNGKLAQGAELQLEIADVDFDEVDITGSLIVEAENIVGHKDSNGATQYSNQTGKISLHRVRINNSGADFAVCKPLWRNGIQRNEAVKIYIQGNGEFHAEDVVFNGTHSIEVADGERVIAKQGPNASVELTRHKISKPSWSWRYSVDKESGSISASIQR